MNAAVLHESFFVTLKKKKKKNPVYIRIVSYDVIFTITE